MLSEEMVKKLKDLVVDNLGVEPNQVVPEAHFIEDLGADSLDLVELIMSIEEEFEIEIPDDDAEAIATVKDAMEYLEEKLDE
ncbi:MAG: acyl carrier protein [Chloroflexia bacterium]|nr:acyl carrier protein [Chloroflexia bacterium]